MKSVASSQPPSLPHKYRCHACGQPFDPDESSECPLCGFHTGSDAATGKDVTPYAVAHEGGRRGWHAMCEWVWFSGAGRLQHLALMRASGPSRRFARNNRLVLAAALALWLATSVGWREIAQSTAIDPQREPVGRGWIRLVATAPAETEHVAEDTPVVLWWSPIQAICALGGGLVVALALLLMVEGLLRWLIAVAHGRSLREELRMTAAMHYATAWWLPVAVGLLVGGLKPIATLGRVARWRWYPTPAAFELSGAVVVAFGAVLWWFWLVRLGMTAPARRRARVVVVMAAGALAVVAISGSIAWFGAWHGLTALFALCRLTF